MKRSDTGDFCVLYIEPDDEKESIFRVISEQKKPIVIMLMGRGQRSEPPGERPEMRVFQRPEDFAELKHLRRHLGVPVLFVISGSESQPAELAALPPAGRTPRFSRVSLHGYTGRCYRQRTTPARRLAENRSAQSLARERAQKDHSAQYPRRTSRAKNHKGLPVWASILCAFNRPLIDKR